MVGVLFRVIVNFGIPLFSIVHFVLQIYNILTRLRIIACLYIQRKSSVLENYNFLNQNKRHQSRVAGQRNQVSGKDAYI